jgi:hypothetical protein
MLKHVVLGTVLLATLAVADVAQAAFRGGCPGGNCSRPAAQAAIPADGKTVVAQADRAPSYYQPASTVRYRLFGWRFR